MKRILSTAALGLSFLATTAAIAGEGYVTTNVNLRAGPDTGYPDVATLYAGTSVAIEGCVDGWSWCDVAYGDSRGWVPANYLQQEYQGQRVLVPEYGVRIGIPVISFVFGSYWDSYYRGRSWYGNRERWSRVTPQYQTHAEHDYAHTSQAPSQRRVDGARSSAVVTKQSSYQGRTTNGTVRQHSATTEVRSSAQYAGQAKPTQDRSAESRVAVQSHSSATSIHAHDNRASHTGQPRQNAAQSRPIAENHASQPKAVAEHNVAQAKPSKKDTPAKSRPEHQGGKDTGQH